MKKFLTPFLVIICLLIAHDANAQIWKKVKKVAERAADRALGTEEQRDESVIDDVYDIVKGKKKKTRYHKDYPNNPNDGGLEDNSGLEDNTGLEEYGAEQVGFTRGGNVIFADNFQKDAIGDFPAGWNTTLGGEIKKLRGIDGKWLKIPANSKVFMDLDNSLPENFTFEMDIIMPSNIEYKLAGIGFMRSSSINLDNTLSPDQHDGVGLYMKGHNGKTEYFFGNRSLQLRWKKLQPTFSYDRVIKLAFEVNNHNRLRIYVDGKKIVDAPKLFKPKYANAIIIQALTHGAAASIDNYFYISNVVIAETGVDQRSRVSKELLESGTFTTNDILFASGSDRIQPSSYNILNQVGEAMVSSPSDKFIIIGHTDNVGNSTTNQKLSKNRAKAVKDFLINNFHINASQLAYEGKGATNPIVSNNTAAEKAQNRRVEFKKL